MTSLLPPSLPPPPPFRKLVWHQFYFLLFPQWPNTELTANSLQNEAIANGDKFPSYCQEKKRPMHLVKWKRF